MPREATIGRLLLENALPESVRGELGVLDKKGVARLGAALAALGPDAYREAMRKLTQVSNQGGYESGGYSFGPEDMIPGPQTRAIRDDLKQQVSRILANSRLDPKTRDNEIARVSLEAMQPLQDAALGEARASNNPLAKQVDSGAKGSGVNLRALLAGDVVYTDQNFRPIPYPVVHSFAEGMRPHEYAASTFGARQSISQTKLGTAKGGYLSKRLGNMAHRLVVTAHDGLSAGADDAPTGLPVKTSDPDNENAFLAHPVGGFQRNTHLTRDVLSTLQKQGIDKILVRSPLVGGPGDGGVYGLDVGVRERNRVSPIGDFVGRAAADSLCLAAGTLIRMADGSVKAIETIIPGDVVLGSNVDGVLRPTRVVRLYNNGVRTCYRTTFRLGSGQSKTTPSMVSTLDHKILAVFVSSKMAKKRIKPPPTVTAVRDPRTIVGDEFYAKLSTSFDDSDPSFVDDPFAAVLGLLIGDGSYTGGLNSNGVGFSCYDPELTAEAAVLFSALGCRLVNHQPGALIGEFRVSDINGGKSPKGGSRSGIRNPIRAKLVAEGMWGQSSYQKTFPDTSRWRNASVRKLIGGLFATDGHVHVNKDGHVSVGFGSSSRVVAESLRELLIQRVGVYPSNLAVSKKKHPQGGVYRDVYAFTVNGYDTLRRLASWIDIPGCKRQRLIDAIAKAPPPRRSMECGRCRLMSQELVGDLPTYDIEVEHEDHLFMLDSMLIVSNSEPVTQSIIGSKHTGGVAGTTGVQQGFDTIERMFSVPSVYQGGVTHAQRDGSITDVRPAPQGGHYVVVDGEEHYVHPDLKPIVTTGTKVEAGDPLSDGVLNPHELVQHKGIGEARRQFVNEFLRVGKLSSVNAHRRNVELVARGFIDHVHMNQEYGDYSPGEIAPYTVIASEYEPRDGHQRVSPKDAKGMYLERPAIHYTIGTRITPSVVDTLNAHGVGTVTAHKEPPPFSPVLIRSNDSLAYDRDWATQMLGSGLEKSLLKSVARGAVSDPGGTSYVPALAEGIHFGDPGTKTRGWTPPSKPGLV